MLGLVLDSALANARGRLVPCTTVAYRPQHLRVRELCTHSLPPCEHHGVWPRLVVVVLGEPLRLALQDRGEAEDVVVMRSDDQPAAGCQLVTGVVWEHVGADEHQVGLHAQHCFEEPVPCVDGPDRLAQRVIGKATKEVLVVWEESAVAISGRREDLWQLGSGHADGALPVIVDAEEEVKRATPKNLLCEGVHGKEKPALVAAGNQQRVPAKPWIVGHNEDAVGLPALEAILACGFVCNGLDKRRLCAANHHRRDVVCKRGLHWHRLRWGVGEDGGPAPEGRVPVCSQVLHGHAKRRGLCQGVVVAEQDGHIAVQV